MSRHLLLAFQILSIIKRYSSNNINDNNNTDSSTNTDNSSNNNNNNDGSDVNDGNDEKKNGLKSSNMWRFIAEVMSIRLLGVVKLTISNCSSNNNNNKKTFTDKHNNK